MLKVLRFSEFPYVVGHRGAASYAPENTLASFKKGLACGADLLECDVHLSKDGQVVIIHDDTVNRTTHSPSKIQRFVHELTLKELRSLDVGNGEKIPTLTEALRWVKKTSTLKGFIIEIKPCSKDPRPLAGPILEVIEKSKALEKCMVISFDHAIVGEIKKLNPKLITGLLYSKPEDLDSDIFKLCKKYRADTLWPSIRAVTPKLVRLAHKKNLGVFTWVANTEKKMKLAVEAGVDAIGSDCPDRLRNLDPRLK